jgi:hypothetical protein
MRVAITGHMPDAFIQSHYTEGEVSLIAEGVVATFKRQFEEKKLTFNVGGAIGADQWFASYLKFKVNIGLKSSRMN